MERATPVALSDEAPRLGYFVKAATFDRKASSVDTG